MQLENVYAVFFVLWQVSAKTQPPHIIIIIGDDMGYNDVGYHGSNENFTPNIDALAYNGIPMERYYTQETCTPSRAALLTGQYPIRTGYQGFPMRPGEDRRIPHNVQTLPRLLKDLGYSTYLLGKWHLGHAQAINTPIGYGYDRHYGYWNGYINYFQHNITDFEKNGLDFHDNLAPVLDKNNTYFTDILTEEAVNVIKSHSQEKPLHLVVSHLAPHTGVTTEDLVGFLQVKDEVKTREKYSYIKDDIRKLYAGTVEELDTSVGEIMKALADTEFLENSIVIFFTDNGAPTYGDYENRGSNWPYRGIKGTLFEGGVRTPAVIYSPHIKNLGRTYNQLFHITDWLPTLYRAAGGDTSQLAKIDGIDQWENLSEDLNEPRREEILLNYNEVFHYSGYLEGQYKLLNSSFANNANDNFTGSSGRSFRLSYDVHQVLRSATNQAINPSVFSRYLKTFWNAYFLRRKTSTQNCRTNRPLDLICKGICLFDLEDDPCETTDVSKKYPEIKDRLWKKLMQYASETVPQQNKKVDGASDPKYCDGVWFNWKDGDQGCYFTNGHKTFI